MKKIEPEKYFTGPQLVLAKAIQAGDSESVIRLSKTTDLNTGKRAFYPAVFALNEVMYNGNPQKG
jgi:hypothetical protein